MTAEEMEQYLIKKLSSNYTRKFNMTPTKKKNEFSVSQLVSGPGNALSYRKRNQVVKRDDGTEEEPEVFNVSMFRGSAIHKYAESYLPDWYAYERLVIKESIPYSWRDGTQDIILYGHPDFCKQNMVLELKTVSSDAEISARKKYVDFVVLKAKRQVGAYAKMLTHEIHQHYFAYVVVIDDHPTRNKITDADKINGFIMVNEGQRKVFLNERMIKRGWVADFSLYVHLLTEDELWHGYNYVRWCARKTAEMIEDEEGTEETADPDEIPKLRGKK